MPFEKKYAGIEEKTGTGVGRKYLLHMVDQFFQDNTSATRKYEGTGVGLPLAKALVGLLSGDI